MVWGLTDILEKTEEKRRKSVKNKLIIVEKFFEIC